MVEDMSITPRDDAVLGALGSIAKLLGREIEFENFVSYVKWAGKDNMPSPQDIASHTPAWVVQLMPVLGRLYDKAFYEGQKLAGEAYRDIFKKDKA